MPEREMDADVTDVTRISVDEDMEGIWLTRSWRGDLENDVLRLTEPEAEAIRDLLDEHIAQNDSLNEGGDDA